MHMMTDLALSLPHPHWCDPRLCTAETNWGRDSSTFVVHEMVLLSEGGHRVDISQGVTLDPAGRPFESEQPVVRVLVPSEGYMTPGMARRVAAAVTEGAALAGFGSHTEKG